MPAQYTVGQVLPNGATVTADTFKTLPDGTTVEFMVDSARNETTITTPGAGTPDANRSTLQTRATAALTANATYLALAAPTAAQNTAQIQTLTKEATATIRLLLGLLDSTAGT